MKPQRPYTGSNEVESAVVQDAEVVEELTELEPTLPKLKFNYHRRDSGYRYYLRIQSQLPAWWHEFNTAQNERGGLKYKDVWQFAKSKGETELECEYIKQMIGAPPQLRPGRYLSVPYLGDWVMRRLHGFTAPGLPKQVQALAKAFQNSYWLAGGGIAEALEVSPRLGWAVNTGTRCARLPARQFLTPPTDVRLWANDYVFKLLHVFPLLTMTRRRFSYTVLARIEALLPYRDPLGTLSEPGP